MNAWLKHDGVRAKARHVEEAPHRIAAAVERDKWAETTLLDLLLDEGSPGVEALDVAPHQHPLPLGRQFQYPVGLL